MKSLGHFGVLLGFTLEVRNLRLGQTVYTGAMDSRVRMGSSAWLVSVRFR